MYALMAYGGCSYEAPLITNLRPNGSGWSWEFYSGTFNMKGVGPKAGLDILEKKKISCHCRESKDDSSFIQSVARSLQYNDCIFFSWRDSPLVGLGLLLIHEEFCGFYITHNDTPQSAGLLWTGDQLVAETST